MVSVSFPVPAQTRCGACGHSPRGGFLFALAVMLAALGHPLSLPEGIKDRCMDKDCKEALQVAKELTAKFIETRTVSPGNFAEIFPAVYRVVRDAIREGCGTGDKA